MKKTPYEITLDEERRIVRLVVKGELSKTVGEQAITEVRTKAMGNKYNIFCDVRHAKVRASFSDWFYMPRNLEIYKTTKGLKTTILITKGKQEEEYNFFENVAYNLGINIKIFYEEQDAFEWLETS